jgi:serine/threonine protein kinase
MFFELLKGYHVSRVSPDIYRLLEDKFAVRFDNVYQSGDPEAAFDLYNAAKDYPSKTTAAAFQKQFNISVTGLFGGHSESARLFQANRVTGELLVIKVPFHSESQKPDEVKVCEELSSILEAPRKAFVPTSVDLVEVRSLEDVGVFGRRGEFYALVMPRFAGTLAEPLCKYSEETVLGNTLRIVGALECLHDHKYVHMDIKGANIFLDRHGSWYLSDFGSCVKVGEPISSYTQWFYPERLRLGVTPARFLYDWYMLGVALVIQLTGEPWKELLDESAGAVNSTRITAAVGDIVHEPLRRLITTMLSCDAPSLPNNGNSEEGGEAEAYHR